MNEIPHDSATPPGQAGHPQTPRVLLPPVFFLLFLLASIGLHYTVPLMRIVPPPWNFAGALVIVLAVAMAALAAGAFARADTAIIPFQPSSALVTGGFYRFTRNPMYLGMLLTLLGADVLMGSLTPFLLLPLFMWVIQQRFIRHEEAILVDTFGDEYRAYRERVRRWL